MKRTLYQPATNRVPAAHVGARRAGQTLSGFSLIELMVVVLILAILTAIALPIYLQTQANSEKRVCQSNMSAIAKAVQSARVETKAPDYAFAVGVPDPAKEPDMQAVPSCPSGGSYTIIGTGVPSNSMFKVMCTVHGDFVLGVPPP